MSACLRSVKLGLTSSRVSGNGGTRVTHISFDSSPFLFTRKDSCNENLVCVPCLPTNSRHLTCSSSSTSCQFQNMEMQSASLLSLPNLSAFEQDKNSSDVFIHEASRLFYKNQVEIENQHGRTTSIKCTNVRNFRLPPESLWFPLGSRHHGKHIFCSIVYSDLENLILKEHFEECRSYMPGEIEAEPARNIRTNLECKQRLSQNYSSFTLNCSQNVHDSSLASDAAKFIYCAVINKGDASSSGKEPSNDPSSKPTLEQLSFILNTLAIALPKLFIQSMDYKIYSNDIVFENKIRGITTVGLFPYVKQVAILRTVGHLKFAYIKFEILKITKHPEDGTVRVRWRIKGLQGFKAILQFWKLKLWNLKESMAELEESWYDGFSTFFVGGNGLIYKHVADSMMPDDDKQTIDTKAPLAAKMALLLGLLPRSSTEDTTSFLPFDLASTFEFQSYKEQEIKDCAELMLPLDKMC